MPLTFNRSSWKINSFGSYFLLLASIFVTELSVMDLGTLIFQQLTTFQGALLNSSILTAIFCLPMFLFNHRLKLSDKKRRGLPRAIYLKTLAWVFVIDFCVMLLFPQFWGGPGFAQPGLLDAMLTTLLCALPLWGLFRHQDLRHREISLADYLNSPGMLYILLLALIFLADLALEILLPIVFGGPPSPLNKIFGSILTTLFIAPILWLMVTRPLQRAALSEQTRNWAVYAQVIDAMITFDERGMIGSFNPAAERIFGYDSEEIIDQPVSRLFLDGEAQLEEMLGAVRASEARPDSGLSYGLIGCGKNGDQLSMDVSISKMEFRDHVEFLLVMRDVSERKRNADALKASEARFRQIFEKTDDAVIFLQPQSHQIIDLNSTMKTLFGYSSEELYQGGLPLVFPPDDLHRVMNLFESLEEQDPAQLDNLTGRRKDGSEFTLSLRIKVMQLNDLDILYCTIRDVTDRVRMEQEAREIQSKLIQANKMTSLGLMVSGVAHEINNPNNFILSNAQMLERCWIDAAKVLQSYYRENGDFLLGGLPYSQLEEHAPALFAGINEGSRRISEIVENLKGFARQESVSLDQEVDMNLVVKSAISILRHEIVRFTDHFEFTPEDNLPKIRGNRHQLGQVIVNLIMNAGQALSDQSKPIKVKTAHEPDAEQVVISIEDNGGGMTEEAASLIMEPFFTTKLDSGGTGLGLSICRSIIKDHRGKLEFTTRFGQGTTFFVRLPVQTAQLEAEGP